MKKTCLEKPQESQLTTATIAGSLHHPRALHADGMPKWKIRINVPMA